MSTQVWRLACCAAGIALAAAGTASAQEDEAGISLGLTPSPAVVQTLDGKPVDLSRVVGTKPALIEFWATWCPRCRALEPRLRAAEARYGGRVQFIAVAVAVNETVASVRRHLAEHPAPYPFVWDAQGAAGSVFSGADHILHRAARAGRQGRLYGRRARAGFRDGAQPNSGRPVTNSL